MAFLQYLVGNGPSCRAPREYATPEKGPFEGAVSVNTAATEAGHLSRRIQARERLTV